MNIYDGADIFLRDFAAVPAGIRPIFATHWAQSEIENGGMAQLFFNSTGVLVPEAVEGFEALGMPEASRALAAAKAVFPEPYPRDREDRLAPFDLPSEADARLAFKRFAHLTGSLFAGLDQKFWAAMKEERGGYRVVADRYAEELKADLR